MDCFTACFGNFRKGNTKKRRKVLSRDQISSQRCGIQRSLQPVEKSLIPEKLEKHEDELNLINKKNVTFDTSVKTHEPISIHESPDSLDLIEIAIKNDEPGNILLDPTTSPQLPKDRSFPPNHRYMNYTEGSEEEEEEDAIGDDQETDLNDDSEDDNESALQQVWSEAIPIASMEAKTDEVEEDSSMKLSGSPVHTVLNPLENMFEWKAAKSSQVTIIAQKENQHHHYHDLNPKEEIDLTESAKSSQVTIIAQKENHHHHYHDLNPKDDTESMEEIDPIDASLSNWLVTTPRSYNKGIEKNSSENREGSSKSGLMWRRIEDRPILGALTVEELNKYSGSSLRSPSQSPRDNMPIIGTVGSCNCPKLESSGNNINKKYTSSGSGSVPSIKGFPNTCSKYREDKKVNWHSTPFEKRLDRALRINSPPLQT